MALQKTIASPGRGILAIDESNATCGKRLASIGLDNTEANRQAYRQLLLTTPGLGKYISGAILFEETLYQSTKDGKKFVECLRDANIVPGIKVDKVCRRKKLFCMQHIPASLLLNSWCSAMFFYFIYFIFMVLFLLPCRVCLHCLGQITNLGAKV